MKWESLGSYDDSERGCGDAVDEGCYANGGTGSPLGALETWTWVLGQHIYGGRNFAFNAPPRQMRIINLRASLYTGELTNDDLPVPDDHPVAKLPKMALLDHVGSNNYTPYNFAQEVIERGPNRRITEEIAAAIAPYLPVPILFTHDDMPVFEKADREKVLEWAGDWGHKVSSRQFGATVDQENFTLYSPNIEPRGYHGNDHWMIVPLAHMNTEGGGRNKPLPKLMDVKGMMLEQTLGISWITRAIFIAPPDVEAEKLAELAAKRIQPVKRKALAGMSKEQALAVTEARRMGGEADEE